MGRRPGDAEGAWARLGENDAGDGAEFAPDFLHQSLSRGAVRLATLLPLIEHGFDAGGCCAHESRRAPLERALAGVAGLRPGAGDLIVKIATRSL